MRLYVSFFVLVLVFVSIGILSGYKTENSSACSTPPEIIVYEPKDSANVDNPPVAINFDAKQNTNDLVAIDLNKVSVIIKDNLGKVIDITQYISNNCDILKKNCKFSGSVNLSEGEYILQVQVCNTTAACETKEVRFYLGYPNGILQEWEKKIITSVRRFIGRLIECNDGKDNDGDGYTDSDGGGEPLLSDEKCKALNSIGEKVNRYLSDEVYVTASKGGTIILGSLYLYILPNVLPEDMRFVINRIPPEGKEKYKLWFDDEYEIIPYKKSGDEFSGELNEGGIVVMYNLDYIEDKPLSSGQNPALNITFYDEYSGKYISSSVITDGYSRIVGSISEFSKKKTKASEEIEILGDSVNTKCFDLAEYKIVGPRCGASDTCAYGSFAFSQCTGNCYYKDGFYKCCTKCDTTCPVDICPYYQPELRDNFYECKGDEWADPTEYPEQCERREQSASGSCNEIVNSIFKSYQGKFGAATKADIEVPNDEDVEKYILYENIRNEGSKVCADFSFGEMPIIATCVVGYPIWENPTCPDYWQELLKNIERHEAGHCQISIEEAKNLSNKVKRVKMNMCGSSENNMISNGYKEMSRYFESQYKITRYTVEKRNKSYDYDTQHGKTQGAFLDCGKCN